MYIHRTGFLESQVNRIFKKKKKIRNFLKNVEPIRIQKYGYVEI